MGVNKRLFVPQDTGLVATENFAIKTFSGNGGNQTVTGVGFQSDLLWFKNRTDVVGYRIYDVTRGLGGTEEYLDSTSTDKSLVAGTGGVTDVSSDGFTVGAGNAHNGLNDNIVTYCFKAGGAAANNADGTITSSVSANPDAGFSIVKYTANAVSGATIGHGLNQELDFLIVKNINLTTQAWNVYVKDVTNTDAKYLRLNQLSGILTTSNARFDVSKFDSDVFSVGNDNSTNGVSGTDQYIAYCFHSVDGYQKFGTYSGTGSTNAITGVGFQPRFLMVKRTDTDGNWQVWDSTHNPSADNNNNDVIYFNRDFAATDAGSGVYVSFDSDGFTFYGASGNNNSTTGSYIYWAIA
jgi:hypothetical protein